MILDELSNYARERVALAKEKECLESIKKRAMETKKGEHRFFTALEKENLRFICEVKKASPSKGIISEDFPYLEIAKAYEKAGADAISVLTEPKWFLGSDEIFKEIRKNVSTPMIRKDFTVDEYQIYEAKLMGADAVLLICAILDTKTIKDYIQICDELGLDALVETHNEEEIASALEAGARIIGVNNRNLKDFSVDFSNASRLREKIPSDILFACESGVKDGKDIEAIAKMGADAALIGETLMRAEDKKTLLQQFFEAAGR